MMELNHIERESKIVLDRRERERTKWREDRRRDHIYNLKSPGEKIK